MRKDIILSTGRVIGHRPYLSNGEPNGATEAFVIDGGEMTNQEWTEYCSIIHNLKNALMSNIKFVNA